MSIDQLIGLYQAEAGLQCRLARTAVPVQEGRRRSIAQPGSVRHETPSDQRQFGHPFDLPLRRLAARLLRGVRARARSTPADGREGQKE